MHPPPPLRRFFATGQGGENRTTSAAQTRTIAAAAASVRPPPFFSLDLAAEDGQGKARQALIRKPYPPGPSLTNTPRPSSPSPTPSVRPARAPPVCPPNNPWPITTSSTLVWVCAPTSPGTASAWVVWLMYVAYSVRYVQYKTPTTIAKWNHPAPVIRPGKLRPWPE
ncbi:hypothetical protein V493_03178 [Pseudogymnoascus sp. VKM F-4281 (FW-2241)]|nr:hypothetical protein V493_03178 [Pseudogymnoascus sp. VKM F-4281 (FW-2241)]